MSLRWVRRGDLEDGTWHLAPLEMWEERQLERFRALCGAIPNRTSWTHTDEKGWKWVRDHGAMICLKCIDQLPVDSTITLVWNSSGIFTVD